MMTSATLNTRDLERELLLHRALSRLSRACSRAETSDELFQETCRIAVEYAGFRYAWLALSQPQLARLHPVAHSGGPHGLLAPLLATVDPRLADFTADGHALQRDVLRSLPAGQDDARALGLESAILLPLLPGSSQCGLLALYTSEADAFRVRDYTLLREFADEVCRGLTRLKLESQRSAQDSKLQFFAYYDPVSGLPNRGHFESRLDEMCAQAQARELSLAVLDIRLDRFAGLFRNLGRQAVAELILQISQRIESCVGADEVAARLDSDELAIASYTDRDGAGAMALAEGLRERLIAAYRVEAKEIFIDAMVGIALYPAHGAQPALLLQRAGYAADAALHGRAVACCFYEPGMDRHSLERFGLEAELHHALANQEFELFYQPQLELVGGRIVGMEALLRWRHPQRGLLPPAEFIGILEQTGLIIPVGAWVLQTACRQNKAWQDAGLEPRRMAVNVSAAQFSRGHVVEWVGKALQDSGLLPEWLELELTESLTMEDTPAVVKTMHELKALGISLSIDDFGTGYSSLSYLSRYPVDRLKIDQSFVRHLSTEPNAAAIAQGILALAHSLNLAVIAEGVETEAQLGYLRKHRCEEIQGYLFAKPLPGDAMTAQLREDRHLALPEQDNGRVLLVVDDEVPVTNAVKRLLRRDAVQVLVANTPQEGFELLAKRCVQVIVCDQRMPLMSGTEFLAKVKRLHPEIISMVLTGYTDLNSVVEAVNHGRIYKFMTKPWDDDCLRESILEAFLQAELMADNRALRAELAALRGMNGRE